MRVTVIGRSGQVALALLECSDTTATVTCLGRPDIDLAGTHNIKDQIAATQPDAIVNAAAYTDVDGAERQSERAFAVNSRAAGRVAAIACALRVPLVHLSSEYVFDGECPRPYREDDAPAPLNVYGASKLEGEHAVAAGTDDYAIVRTSWLYSPYGRNFLTKIRLRAMRQASIPVVDDRLGAPTSSKQVARGALLIADNLKRSSRPELRGIFHVTCAGETTWARFAAEIVAQSREPIVASCTVHPVPSIGLAEIARRPMNSRLDNSRVAATHGLKLDHWKVALAEIMAEISPMPSTSIQSLPS